MSRLTLFDGISQAQSRLTIMDRKIFTFVFFALVSTLFPEFLRAEREELNRIVALVDREAITENELNDALRMKLGIFTKDNPGFTSEKAEKEMDGIKQETLEELVNQKLILSQFKKMGGAVEEKRIDAALETFVIRTFQGDRKRFEESLAKQGLSVAQFRKAQGELLAIQILNNSFKEGNPPHPDKRKALYDELIKTRYSDPDQLEVRLLSIPRSSVDQTAEQQETLAQQIQKEIAAGASFEEKARQYSRDPFAEKGGYVGFIDRGTLNENITSVAFKLPDKQVSEVIEDSIMWRILIVESRKKTAAPTLEELTPQVDAMLFEQARKSWLEDLRQRANIVIH